MAGDIWEQAVETYLATDRGVFLNPQYLIGTPSEWEAYADFLALDFPNRRAWMVEVTKAPKYTLFDKIKNFENEYVRRIGDQLKGHHVIRAEGPADEWAIGLWVFAPQSTVDGLERRMRTANVQTYDVTALEETLAPSSWEKRFR